MTTSALILMITVWTLVIGTLTYLFRKLLKKQNEAKQQSVVRQRGLNAGRVNDLHELTDIAETPIHLVCQNDDGCVIVQTADKQTIISAPPSGVIDNFAAVAQRIDPPTVSVVAVALVIVTHRRERFIERGLLDERLRIQSLIPEEKVFNGGINSFITDYAAQKIVIHSAAIFCVPPCFMFDRFLVFGVVHERIVHPEGKKDVLFQEFIER